MTAALTDTEVARLRGLLDALDRALRPHDSTTDHHPDAVEILRAMNVAGRGEEVEDEPHPIGTVVEDADGHVWTRRPNGMWSVKDADGWADFAEVTRYGDVHTIATDTPTPAPDVTVEVRAPRWHKGEDTPGWLVPGATVRVVKCDSGTSTHIGVTKQFSHINFAGYAVLPSDCWYATVLELVAPAPEPAVDWAARAKAAEAAVARGVAEHDRIFGTNHTCQPWGVLACFMVKALRGES